MCDQGREIEVEELLLVNEARVGEEERVIKENAKFIRKGRGGVHGREL